jgi:hypothetical protein
MVQFKKLNDLNRVQYCDCCEIVTQCNLNAHQREFYRFHDILQVPIAGNYFDNPIKKIKEDEIPIYEIKYVVLRQEFQGVPYLLLKQRDKI